MIRSNRNPSQAINVVFFYGRVWKNKNRLRLTSFSALLFIAISKDFILFLLNNFRIYFIFSLPFPPPPLVEIHFHDWIMTKQESLIFGCVLVQIELNGLIKVLRWFSGESALKLNICATLPCVPSRFCQDRALNHLFQMTIIMFSLRSLRRRSVC